MNREGPAWRGKARMPFVPWSDPVMRLILGNMAWHGVRVRDVLVSNLPLVQTSSKAVVRWKQRPRRCSSNQGRLHCAPPREGRQDVPPGIASGAGDSRGRCEPSYRAHGVGMGRDIDIDIGPIVGILGHRWSPGKLRARGSPWSRGIQCELRQRGA